MVNIPTLKGQNCKKRNIFVYLEMRDIIMRLIPLKKFSKRKHFGVQFETIFFDLGVHEYQNVENRQYRPRPNFSPTNTRGLVL